MNRTQIRNLISTALCVAIGIILPITLHSVPNAGRVLLPMHIPVLLCGLLCGWPYGIACGIATPLLSSLLTGMPPAPVLPSMLAELAVYGLVSGLLSRAVRINKPFVGTIVSLLGAMLAGRVVMGILNALIFNVGEYSMQAWIAASFVTALPGIAIQLVLLPILVQALIRAGLAGNAKAA